MSDPKPPLTERELMDEQLAQLQKSDREIAGPRRRFRRIRVPKHGTADASPTWPLVLVSVLVPPMADTAVVCMTRCVVPQAAAHTLT